ncbi:MAG: magnesium transporter [Lentisphaeria bacterium]|nr:magnesium transporter [Lentisphaeria bacterium]
MGKLEELLKTNNFSIVQRELQEMNPVDIANEMGELDTTDMIRVFRLMSKELAAEVFAYLDENDHQTIARQLSTEEAQHLVEDMSLDDAVDFLDELPSDMVRNILAKADPDTRKLINTFLKYPDNSAGSLMTVEFVRLYETQTCKEAIAYVRSSGIEKETIYTCYVTDQSTHLTGIVSLREILTNKDETLIRDIMSTDFVSATTLEDQEQIAQDFKKYDLIAMPVLDMEQRIVGIITVDDIMDVIEDEQTEDLERIAGMQHAEKGYLDSSVWELSKNRIIWLMVLMVSATITASVITRFNKLLEGMIALTAFIPMLMDTGGNSGSQASTLMVRGLAVGEVTLHDWRKVIWKELRVGFVCASILGTVNFLRIMAFNQATWQVNLVVNLTLFFTVMVAKTLGSSMPMAARLAHLDPALMASPMLTTMVDLFTLLIYFTIATKLLPMLGVALTGM